MKYVCIYRRAAAIMSCLFVVAVLTGCGESTVDHRSRQPDTSNRDDGQQERNENGNREDDSETGSGSVDAPSRTATAFCTPIRLQPDGGDDRVTDPSPSITEDSTNTQLYSDSECQTAMSPSDESNSRDHNKDSSERDRDGDKQNSEGTKDNGHRNREDSKTNDETKNSDDDDKDSRKQGLDKSAKNDAQKSRGRTSAAESGRIVYAASETVGKYTVEFAGQQQQVTVDRLAVDISTDIGIDELTSGQCPTVRFTLALESSTRNALTDESWLASEIPAVDPVSPVYSVEFEIRSNGLQLHGSSDCSTRGPLNRLQLDAGQPERTLAADISDSSSSSAGFEILQAGEVIADYTVGTGGSTDQFEPSTYSVPDRSGEALVVYNSNISESKDVAEYYTDKRGIPDNRLCGARLPVDGYLGVDVLFGLRRTVAHCICDVIPESTRPSPCSVEQGQALAEASPITTLVLMKGVPRAVMKRFRDTNGGRTGYSLGYVLSSSIYAAPGKERLKLHRNAGNDGGYLDVPQDTAQNYGRPYGTGEQGNGQGSRGRAYLPPLDPAKHYALAYGRVEATTWARTKDLIDRTIQAENKGINGNAFTAHTTFTEDDVSGGTGAEDRQGEPRDYAENLLSDDVISETKHQGFWGARYLEDAFGAVEEDCFDYLTGSPFEFEDPSNSWARSRDCRVGETTTPIEDALNSGIPGEEDTTVPYPTDAVLYAGQTAANKNHSAFNNFETMIRWRKGNDPESCVAVCSNFNNAQSQQNCRQKSTDVFNEINTECVGVADGFMAYQKRSYPVQFMGFYPKGWRTDPLGRRAKTIPKTLTGGAFQNARFADDRFIRFGVKNLSSSKETCRDRHGNEIQCKQDVLPNLRKTLEFPPVSVPGPKTFKIKLRYRNGASPNADLSAILWFEQGSSNAGLGTTIDLSNGHSDWQTHSVNKTIGANAVGGPTDLSKATLIIWSRVKWDQSRRPNNYIDLDGIEIIHPNGTQIIDKKIGSFAKQQRDTTGPGSWAANVIDRLGGIGTWGSRSHYDTAGSAYNRTHWAYSAFLNGRPIGEALLTGNLRESGMVYVDPMYRPAAASIRLVDSRTNDEGIRQDGQLAKTASELRDGWRDRKVRLKARMGFNPNSDRTAWRLQHCPEHNLKECETMGWRELFEGQQSVKDTATLGVILDQIDIDASEEHTLRIAVWNREHDTEPLYWHLYLERP